MVVVVLVYLYVVPDVVLVRASFRVVVSIAAVLVFTDDGVGCAVTLAFVALETFDVVNGATVVVRRNGFFVGATVALAGVETGNVVSS